MARRKKEPGAAHLAVEGPLGAGKSVFAAAWAERRGARRIRIEAEDNPFLPEGFERPDRAAFSAQMYFLLARQRLQEELRQGELFGSGVLTEGVFERDRVYADVFLSEPERALHGRIYDVLAERVAAPDLVVWLVPAPESVLDRLRVRARPYERALDEGRVRRLTRAFSELLGAWSRSPVLEVRMGQVDLGEDDGAVARLLAETERTRGDRLAPGERRRLDLG